MRTVASYKSYGAIVSSLELSTAEILLTASPKIGLAAPTLQQDVRKMNDTKTRKIRFGKGTLSTLHAIIVSTHVLG